MTTKFDNVSIRLGLGSDFTATVERRQREPMTPTARRLWQETAAICRDRGDFAGELLAQLVAREFKSK